MSNTEDAIINFFQDSIAMIENSRKEAHEKYPKLFENKSSKYAKECIKKYGRILRKLSHE